MQWYLAASPPHPHLKQLLRKHESFSFLIVKDEKDRTRLGNLKIIQKVMQTRGIKNQIRQKENKEGKNRVIDLGNSKVEQAQSVQ